MQNKHPTLTPARLRALLTYDQEAGVFHWLTHRQCVRAGALAGSTDKAGYVVIRIDARIYFAHRLAWLYVHGVWPTAQLDHINGVRDDNRFCNLREATAAQNMQNSSIGRNNTSRFPGVYWNTKQKKWRVLISVNHKLLHVGTFSDFEDAVTARKKAKQDLHPFQLTVRGFPQ